MAMTQIADPATKLLAEAKAGDPTVRMTPKEAADAGSAGFALDVPTRYQILTQLGVGGMGIVYKVRDLETGEIVALKVLKPGIASEHDMQEGLRKEVCLARKVTHKNVCRIHEFNRSSGTACLSMEFVEGETLLSRLRRVGPMSAEDSLKIVLQICAGLNEAHAQGIVHRDLKPANIMLDAAGVVKIMDFGIARLSQGTGQMTGTISGTPAYMAPEQLELRSMGAFTDIYAVGLLFYEMVTGQPAFDGDSSIAVALKQIRELPKPPSEIVSGLPGYIEDAISKCLRKDPTKRYQSVNELCAALEKKRATKTNAPGWVSLEVKLPHLPVQRVVEYSKEKARQAGPHVAAFGVQVRQASVEAGRLASHGVKQANSFMRVLDTKADLLVAKMPRKGTVAVALLFVLIGTVGWERHRSKEMTMEGSSALSSVPRESVNRGQAAPLNAIANNDKNGLASRGSSSGLAPAAPAAADRAIATKEVDLNPNSDAAPVRKAGVAATQILKANSAATGLARTKASQGKGSTVALTGVSVSTNGSGSMTTNAVSTPKLPVVEVEPSEDAVPTTLAQPEAVQPKSAAVTLAPAEYFLEVGSFKDSDWADKAVDQLTHLGYHAVAVRKAHLWIQSYHVEVGPYKTTTEMEAAQKTLASQDFKSHQVK